MNDARVVLCIDDDQRFRERMAKALSDRGLVVQAVSNAEDAWLSAERSAPWGIVCDLRMPNVSGLELVKRLLERCPGVRLVVLTGYGSIASAVEAIRLGAKDYLVKPCNADQVLAALEHDGAEASEVALAERTPSLERLEHEHIERVLAECNYNVSKSARVLGIHRRTLQYKLSKLPNAE